MTPLQRLILLSVLHLTAADTTKAVSRQDVARLSGSWNKWRQAALYDLLDRGFLRELYRETDKRTYYSITLQGINSINCAERLYDCTSLYIDKYDLV